MPDAVDGATSGGVGLELRPAGLSPRVCAYSVDWLIRILLGYAAAIVGAVTGVIGPLSSIALFFILAWLYPVVFELARSGATPGKKAFGLAVVMHDGSAVTVGASLLRNLLRLVDFLPLLYGVATVSMLLRADDRRIGDVAAGTLVVHRHVAMPQLAIDEVPSLAPGRPQSRLEAADFGVRLCRREARPIYACYLATAMPVFAIALASFAIAPWLPLLALWWLKPWLDRTILFALSRAAIGQSTTPGDVWRARAQVWWAQIALTFTWRRLSPWRSFTQPVYQLEGLRSAKRSARLRELHGGWSVSAALMTSAFGCAETALAIAALLICAMFVPVDPTVDVQSLLDRATALADPTLDVLSMADGLLPPLALLLLAVCYGAAVLFLEPFYVAAGFGMYLCRRAEIEAPLTRPY